MRSNLLRGLSIVTFGALLSLSTGCAPEGVDEEAIEEASDNGSVALSSLEKCDVANLGSKSCQDMIGSVRLQGFATGRSDIIERGMTWLEAGVKYDAGAYYQGYRRDCSGFVSMAWSYKDSPGTIWFPPFNYSGKYAFELGSLDDLAPGDAVNRRTRIKNSAGNLVGHVMLFGGWATFDHQELFLIHEYSTGKPAALIRIRRSELDDYVAIRSVNAPAPAAPSTTPEPTPEPEPQPTPQPSGECGGLVANQTLGINQGVSSCDGRFTLIQQGDGNLVLYQVGSKALWSTQTDGKPGDTTVMQEDGNLVIYGPGGAIWSSGSHGNPGAWLSLDDHGALIIFDVNGKPIWWNGTGGL